MASSLMARIAKAKTFAGGNIIKDGKYTFTVLRLFINNGHKGNCFIAEMRVDSAEQVNPKVVPNPVGSTASYVLNLDKNESAPGNCKAYVLALLGAKEEEVSTDELAATIEELVDEKTNPARGMRIKDETFSKIIQKGANAGKDFTGHRWEYVPQTAEQIAKQRAELDAAEAAAK